MGEGGAHTYSRLGRVYDISRPSYLGQNKLTTDLPTCFVPVSTEDSHIMCFY
jgi:hypothetical protein